MTSHVEVWRAGPVGLLVKLPEDTTELLQRWKEPAARDRLFEVIYPELRRLAAIRLRRERAGHTLQTADLVNEAFLRLVRQNAVTWQGRVHFLAIAAQCMKRIVLDHARRRASLRRGGGVPAVPEQEIPRADPFAELVELELLLQQLALRKPRLVQTFDLHYFGGLTFDEVGEALSIDPRTAKRDWEFTVRWLREMIGSAV